MTNFVDAISQSFIVPSSFAQGVWVTSVDLYFAEALASDNNTVTVQITEMSNGVPTRNVLKNAYCVSNVNQVKLSTTAALPTRFTFAGPVYVSPNVDYALKIISNSQTCKIWVAKMGEATVQNPRISISAPPTLGSFFKSQNNSTWVPDVASNLMFVINYAHFDIAKSGVVTMNNQGQQGAQETLYPNPFKVTNGSTNVRVHHINHGLFVGANVTYSGSTDTAMNTTFTVISVTGSDHYTVTRPSAASVTDGVGGSVVRCQKSISYDAMLFDVGPTASVKPGTSITCSSILTNATAHDTLPTELISGISHSLNSPRYVHSYLNEATLFGGAKSLQSTIDIASNDPLMSPVIDITEIKMQLFQNNINNPLKTDIITAIDGSLLFNASTGLTFAAPTSTTGNMITSSTVDFSNFVIGAYLTITGTSGGLNATVPGSEPKIINIDLVNSPATIYLDATQTLVNESLGTAATITQYNTFIDEISPSAGTAESKYQHMPIVLQNPATGLQIMFEANIPNYTDIDVYYRTVLVSGATSLLTTAWTLVSPTYKHTALNEFNDLTYSVNGLPSFTSFQVKFVMRSTNTSYIPRIKSFRAIALA